jgi:hypothetical protein
MIHQCVIVVSSLCEPSGHPPQQVPAVAENPAAFHLESVVSKYVVPTRMPSEVPISRPLTTMTLMSLLHSNAFPWQRHVSSGTEHTLRF